jgi:hypothetical protein
MEARRRDESKQDYKIRMGLVTKEIEVKPREVKIKKTTKKED